MKKTLASRFLGLFLLSICAIPLALAQRTQYVVIVVIDGSRYMETFGDSTHSNIPRIWNQLRPKGTIYTSFFNNGTTETNPGHASIVTGTWQTIKNDGTESPQSPTIFEYFRKQKSAGAEKCWVALGKSKLDVIARSAHGAYGMNYAASVRTSASQYDDFIAWDNTRTVLATYHPALTIVNLPATDNAGHGGSWSGYLSAIQRADTLVTSLWDSIQSDLLLRDKTTMIVTNDHGRHTSNFISHGDGCEGCRRLMLLIVGPDTPAGAIDSSTRTQVDIAPTVGRLLGFSTPLSVGVVLASAIVTNIANTSSMLPRQFALDQNYPNPFNPTTAISYRLLAVSDVKLSVFDLLGREVALLVQEQKEAGYYSVQWNASALPSGIYLYRLSVVPSARRDLVPTEGRNGQAVDYVATRKMILTK